MQQAITACRAAERAGSSWLKANTDDPDTARFTALLDSAAGPAPARGSPHASDLDDILAAVLWAAHGPQ